VKRLSLVWFALVAYFVIGYSVAPRQTLLSPEAFSNVLMGAALLLALAFFVRRPGRSLAPPPVPVSPTLPASPIRIRFFFDCGACLWSGDDAALAAYDYQIEPARLPMSDALARQLADLAAEQFTSIDMNDPGGPSPWSPEKFADFRQRTDQALSRLREELGATYLVQDERGDDAETA
jgi:hypothetical protein